MHTLLNKLAATHLYLSKWIIFMSSSMNEYPVCLSIARQLLTLPIANIANACPATFLRVSLERETLALVLLEGWSGVRNACINLVMIL